MSNITEFQEQARKNAEKATRTQTIKAMERLIVGMGGKHAYIAWLQALPENTKLNNAGGLDQSSVTEIAADDGLYGKAVQAFAAHMGPVLMGMVEV